MSDDTMQDRDQRVRERAYAIWLDAGQPEGRAQEHWDQAVAALEEEQAAVTPLTDLAGDPALLVTPNR